MATVIEEAVVRILPSFKDFKPELEAKLKEFTEGEKAEVKVKLQVDARTLHNSIKDSLAGITSTASTVKIRAEFDHAQMKRDFTTALGRATESAASTTTAAKVRIDVNQQSLKASLQSGIREAIRQVSTQTGEGVKVKVEPVLDDRKLKTQLEELSKKTITVKVRYDVDNAPTLARGGSGGGSGGSGTGRRGGSPSSSSSTTLAEFINAFPGVGGIGPNAARAIVGGIAAGAPAIGAAVQVAVMGGLAAGVFAAGITIAAQDQQVKRAAGLMGTQLMGSLSSAAQPFKTELLSLFPQMSTDVKNLQPQLSKIFGALAPSLSAVERGLVGGIQNALKPQAAQNTAQFIDTIAAKLPAMGEAAGRAVTALTDPKVAQFMGQLIDFIDAAIVDVAKFVGWLGRVNEALTNAGVYKTLGTVAKDLVNTIGAAGDVLGPKGLIGIVVAAGAAFLIFGGKAKTAGAASASAGAQATTAWSEARTAFGLYSEAVSKGTAPIQAAGIFRNTGFSAGLRNVGVTAATIGLPLAGQALGSATGGTTGSVISGVGTGAGIGAFAGSFLPVPGGTLIGAGVGAVIGGLVAALNANTDALKAKTGDIISAAQTYQSGGGLGPASRQVSRGDDQALKDVAKYGPKVGIDQAGLFAAVNRGDVDTVQKMLDKAKQAQTGATVDPYLRGHGSAAQAAQPKPALSADDAAKLTTGLGGYVDAAQQNKDALAANTQALQHWATGPFDQLTKLLTGATPTGTPNVFTAGNGQDLTQEANTINQAVTTYGAFITAKRAYGDAQYQQAQTAQQTAQQNEAALHGVAEAEHGLAQAHFATEMAQRSLTDARRDAIANLKELARQVRDIGDNEEQLKINLVEANLAEQQTRGLDPDSLARREAVLKQHQAANALADFRADEPALRQKATEAQQRGVENSTPVLQAKNALSESQRNEHEQTRAVTLAHQAYANTLEASRRANELAGRAVADAGRAYNAAGKELGALESQTGLTTDALGKLYTAADAVNKTFTMQITDNGSTKVAFEAVGNLYQGLAQLAAQYGITLDNWGGTWNATPIDPSAGLGGGGVHGRRVAIADGGPVPGWSPHSRADNIPAMLTADEFVVNVASSRKHRGLLHAINADKYADGGVVGSLSLPLNVPLDRFQKPVFDNLKALGGTSGVSGDATGKIAAVQSWLQSTVDPLPYIFGRTGPSAYDCSGLVGEVWARLTGNKDYQRYFVTGSSERQFLAAHGFKDGTGTFTVGFSGEHTMGKLGGLSFEAANSRDGIIIGKGTSDVTSFPNVMYLPQLGDAFVGSAGANIPADSKVSVGGVWGQIIKKVLAQARAIAAMSATGGDSGKASAADVNVAQTALSTARQMGADNKSILALFEAGIVESGMKNIDYGDRDSLGFLQQRSSWGSAASRLNVADSARRFLARAMGKSFGASTAGSLAQSVQVSAFPDRYNHARAAAAALLHQLDPTIQLGSYDSGGWLHDVGVNTTGRPEAVLNPDESRAYVQHAQAVSATGGEIRLDDYSIARLAQALSTRPIGVHMDGRKVADAVVPHLERRF